MCTIDVTLIDTTTSPGSNGKERLFHIPQSSRTRAQLLDTI